MGGGPQAPPILTPRLEAYESALRLHGYPKEMWAWLAEWARVLHRLYHKLDVVDWRRETATKDNPRGKSMRDVTPADVLPKN